MSEKDVDYVMVVHNNVKDLWYLAWYLAEIQDYGTGVGDEFNSREPAPDRKDQPDEWDVWTANMAAKDAPGRVMIPHEPFYWETEKQAKIALKLVNAALKVSKGAKPLQDWEKKALAAGWKPPRRKKDEDEE